MGEAFRERMRHHDVVPAQAEHHAQRIGRVGVVLDHQDPECALGPWHRGRRLHVVLDLVHGGQEHRERRAASDPGAGRRHPAPMRLDQAPADRETEAEPATAPARRIDLIERLKDRLEPLRDEPASGVVYREGDAFLQVARANGDRAARRRVADGIADEIPHDLAKPCRVASDAMARRPQLRRHAQLRTLHVGCRAVQHVAYHVVHVDDLALERELAMHDAAHVEEVVDEAHLEVEVPPDERQRATAALRRHEPTLEHLDRVKDR